MLCLRLSIVLLLYPCRSIGLLCKRKQLSRGGGDLIFDIIGRKSTREEGPTWASRSYECSTPTCVDGATYSADACEASDALALD